MLVWLDNFLYNTLYKLHDVMPARFAKFIALYYPDARIRKAYAGRIGIEMGEGTYCNLGMKITKNRNEICVHIGKHVSIGPNVTFLCDSCPNNSDKLLNLLYVRDKLIKSADIFVKDDAWIGANTTIFPGVTIGACSIIGAGSIVLKDVEPYSIYAGVPAKKLRNLKDFE